MRINNTFIDTAPLDHDESWHGFLLQLGGWYEDQATDDLNTWFDSVSIVSATETKELKCSTVACDPFDAFEWINIVPRSDSRRPPLPIPGTDSMAGNRDFLEILYPNGTAGMCQNFENFCGCENFGLCNQTSAAGCGAFGERKLCLRLRSLHAWFVPRAILTYWAGGSGYDVTVTGAHHPEQIFTFKDPIDVYVHMRDGAVDSHLDVKEIRIRHKPGVDHGDHKDPPMGGV
jgi:hypothetical protein